MLSENTTTGRHRYNSQNQFYHYFYFTLLIRTLSQLLSKMAFSLTTPTVTSAKNIAHTLSKVTTAVFVIAVLYSNGFGFSQVRLHSFWYPVTRISKNYFTPIKESHHIRIPVHTKMHNAGLFPSSKKSAILTAIVKFSELK